ncbi:MAG: hypothetical protein HUJ68_00725 [Clostridia bacterium]|nr:hypothetical protein [Clostridia bacterium]
MNIKGNLIIFSADNEERIDVRRLKNKKLQVILNEKNELPIFEINNKQYIKSIAEKKVEELFGISRFYIEQLYTWGDPTYCTEEQAIVITYLIILNKNKIKKIPDNFKFYDIYIDVKDNTNIQKVSLSNENKKIQYEIETLIKKERASIEFTNNVIGETEINKLTAIIIHTGIKRLRNRIENTNIAFSFIDEEFAISELQQIYEIILDKKLIAANFRKKIEPMIKKTDKVVKESAYRPSNHYKFNEDFIKNWV